MKRRTFLTRLLGGAAAAIAAVRTAPAAAPELEIPDRELLENIEAGTYDGAPFFTGRGVVTVDSQCPFVFRDTPCGYKGPADCGCDKTFGDCRNPVRFGGFPGARLGAPVYTNPAPGGGFTSSAVKAKGSTRIGTVTRIQRGTITEPVVVEVALE
jgi:hypothetical protein